jgi:outer membrane protein OmpA-like peptidoglycan-associated protein
MAMAGLMLSACSGPDPIERARVAAGRAPTTNLPAVPGEGQPYPSLGTVPARPATTPPAERRALEEALVADRANARYVGQPVVPTVPRAAAPVPVAAAAPAPLTATGGMLMGAEETAPPPLGAPPVPPIAGAPVATEPTAPPAVAAAQVLVPREAPAAPPPAAAAITMEALPPPPAPAMPEELSASARAAAAAAAAPAAAPTPAPEPPPPFPSTPAAAPAPAAAMPPTPPPAPAPVAAAAPTLLPAVTREQAPAPPAASPAALPPAAAPPRPAATPPQPSVVVDRSALLPARATPGVQAYALSFLPGTETLVTQDRAVLAGLAARGRGATFQVTGYGDEAAQGRALDLPLARAQAVADLLRAAGVPAEAIELGGTARRGPAGRGAEVRLVYSR